MKKANLQKINDEIEPQHLHVIRGVPDARYHDRFTLYVTEKDGFACSGTYGMRVGGSRSLRGIKAIAEEYAKEHAGELD